MSAEADAVESTRSEKTRVRQSSYSEAMVTSFQPGPDSGNPLSPTFWTHSAVEREEILANLRASHDPAPFQYPSALGGPPVDFYLLSRYDEVVEASRNTGAFSSEPNATTLDDIPPEQRRAAPSMINLDDPRHARMRRIVSRAFTVKMIRSFDENVRMVARGIVDDLEERGPCDFVTDVARPMPLEIICTMMGIPRELHPEVIQHSETFLAVTDPEHRPPKEAVARSIRFFDEVFRELSKRRREEPAGDIVTMLTSGDVDESLTDRELGVFFRSLVVAGTGTTRNTLAHALALLTEHQDQRELLLEDLPARLPGAVEEVLRYVSPVTFMRRTLTCDYRLGGIGYHEGDVMVLHYGSANRDERIFDTPQVFDIGRTPNPHLGFGAPGPHLCLGAYLARREINFLLAELFTRVPDIHAVGEPVRHPTGLVNGIEHLQCAF